MGPIGSPLSKIGVQVTDSNYVLLSMRVMTRVSSEIWNHLKHDEDFVKCLHSMGRNLFIYLLVEVINEILI